MNFSWILLISSRLCVSVGVCSKILSRLPTHCTQLSGPLGLPIYDNFSDLFLHDPGTSVYLLRKGSHYADQVSFELIAICLA